MKTLYIYVGLLLSLISVVLADTEIRNLHLPLPGPKSIHVLPADHLTISPSSPVELSVSSYLDEQWIVLDFGEDGEAWTVRLSWPGSAPTKWDLAISPLSPRKAILHLTEAPLSPRFPHPLLSQLNSYLPSYLQLIGAQPVDREAGWETGWETKAHILLEPLLLGVIPSTAIPAVGWIVVMIFGAAVVVPRLITWLEAAKRADQVLESDSDSGSTQRQRSKSD